jgi:hypothetical protein
VTWDPGEAVAISIDTKDRPHVVVGGRGVYQYVHRRGYWDRTTVARSEQVDSVAIRVTSSGRTVVAYATSDGLYVVGA